ncbi:MAG: hypothetical protein AAGC55_27080 [Myxococcota bacterium]
MSITDDMRERLRRERAQLGKLREQLKDRLSTAGPAAKRRLEELQPRLRELEDKVGQHGQQVGEVAGQVFVGVGRALRDFGGRITGKR